MNNQKDENIIIVENGYNTCYIDSLLIGLFYVPSNIYNNMLENDPINKDFLYLQEIIKCNFIEPIRKGISVSGEIVNEIRNYSFINGWKINEPHELTEQQDITEYYNFLLENLSNQLIYINRTTITEGITTKDDEGILEKIPFITVTVKEHECEMAVKALINNWLNDNPVDIVRETIENNVRITKNVKGLNIYKISNIPGIIPIHINRFSDNNSIKIMTKIEINKKIKLSNNCDARWIIQSVICHTGSSIKEGHYYCILMNNDKWLMFDDMSIPSLKEIDMSNPELIDKIKSESVFLIYKHYN
ncbi:ubiquitin carboxyl-terminal hydrolase [Catovirus CTV1]|uniref:Ubiquitin carboxyl-terminal hydrolase n=1 Tax=Catovirus CTV1 TaxID=1977631 RepID=A0A1V0SBT5_9VIRU|nr:ubiquitin carboxyl-terminal hydrolase [Catovirus CTV1]